MKKLISIALLSLVILPASAQSLTFNQEKGFMFNIQCGGLLNAIFDNPQLRLSPVVGYKTGKIVFFTGYEMLYYPPTVNESSYYWDEGSLSGDYVVNTLKVGCHIYPHKNQRKVKVFYQALFSYDWYSQISDPSENTFCLGGGIDYFIKPFISVGYDAYFGMGKDLMRGRNGSKLNYNFSLKYFLWKKQ